MAIQTRKLVIGLGLLLLFLVVAVVAFFTLEHYLFKRKGAIEAAAGITTEEETIQPDSVALQREIGEFYQFADIVINPLGGVRRSIVKIGLVGEYNPKEGNLVTELDRKMPRIRSGLLTYLGAVPVETLADITTRVALRDTLLLLINSELVQGQLTELYIVDFIRQ